MPSARLLALWVALSALLIACPHGVGMEPPAIAEKKGRIVHLNHIQATHAIPQQVKRYIEDLRRLFSEYSHVVENFELPVPGNGTVLLHVHQVEEVISAIPAVRAFRDAGVRVLISVHNYLWLYPSLADVTVQHLADSPPRVDDTVLAEQLFGLAHRVIFPSQLLRETYARHIGHTYNFIVAAPPDALLDGDTLSVPRLEDSVNIGVVDFSAQSTRNSYFTSLMNAAQHYMADQINIHFYLFGNDQGIHQAPAGNTKFRGHKFSKLGTARLHALFFVPDAAEAYSYDLAQLVNANLPMMYLNVSSVSERLTQLQSQHHFGINESSEIPNALAKTIKFVIYSATNSSKVVSSLHSAIVKASPWYLSNYPR